MTTDQECFAIVCHQCGQEGPFKATAEEAAQSALVEHGWAYRWRIEHGWPCSELLCPRCQPEFDCFALRSSVPESAARQTEFLFQDDEEAV